MRPLSVGAGRGGSTGEEPPSNVELVEKAGDAGCFDAHLLSNPSSAFAAGGGDECNEEIVAWERQYLCSARLSAHKNVTHHKETSADDSQVVCY